MCTEPLRSICIDPSTQTMSIGRRLGEYDSEALGPLFAVSDEGSAARVILAAAHASAKAAVVGQKNPLSLGVILDGERMTSAGEVPIGPPEYEALRSVAADRLLLTTNIGTRANTRFTQLPPEFDLVENPAANVKWLEAITATTEPFVRTPDRRPRPLTIRLRFSELRALKALPDAMKAINQARAAGRLGPAEVHRVAPLMLFETTITSEGVQQIARAIELSSQAGLSELVLDAEEVEASRKRAGVQSLLNILAPKDLNSLLDKAVSEKVRLVFRYQLDVETVARTIWSGLWAARTQGFDAGKYGLFPLTLAEQAAVMELLVRWMDTWTAIPAFYVDTPLITEDRVIDVSQCPEAARAWLKAARGAGARIVLFDCPDRITPRKLISSDPRDNGILTLAQIAELNEYAKALGVAILWSGGITAQQAFELARLKVHGIFSTSSTATKVAVTAQFESDPRLPAENEPTEFGVRRMHAIVQAGFLSVRLPERGGAEGVTAARGIEQIANQLLKADADASKSTQLLGQLNEELTTAWQQVLGNSLRSQQASRRTEEAHAVPADAVRVFLGRKKAGVKREEFVRKLETTFMPATVQIQRLYGLKAYLPAVVPQNKPDGFPDELALVFYRTQGAYRDAKRCVGGRVYSEIHELVFDMQNSSSGFPKLLEAEPIVAAQPYHLFENSVDWQSGTIHIYSGLRKTQVGVEEFLLKVAEIARRLQKSPDGLDAGILSVTEEWLIFWAHCPKVCDGKFGFEAITNELFSFFPRRLLVPHSLTEPFGGFSLDTTGDAVNFQFLRVQ